jgi:hypothetical protein
MISADYRDGIFSQATPAAAYGSKLTQYNDGSLGGCAACAGGLGDAGKSFRDGIFSTSTPKAAYGGGMQAYSDGSLGALDSAQMVKYALGALIVGGILYVTFGKKGRGRRKG